MTIVGRIQFSLSSGAVRYSIFICQVITELAFEVIKKNKYIFSNSWLSKKACLTTQSLVSKGIKWQKETFKEVMHIYMCFLSPNISLLLAHAHTHIKRLVLCYLNSFLSHTLLYTFSSYALLFLLISWIPDCKFHYLFPKKAFPEM